MLGCKDCVLYDTDACRYGRYVVESDKDMSNICPDFLVEQNRAYHKGMTGGSIKEFMKWLCDNHYIPFIHNETHSIEDILRDYEKYLEEGND